MRESVPWGAGPRGQRGGGTSRARLTESVTWCWAWGTAGVSRRGGERVGSPRHQGMGAGRAQEVGGEAEASGPLRRRPREGRRDKGRHASPSPWWAGGVVTDAPLPAGAACWRTGGGRQRRCGGRTPGRARFQQKGKANRPCSLTWAHGTSREPVRGAGSQGGLGGRGGPQHEVPSPETCHQNSRV